MVIIIRRAGSEQVLEDEITRGRGKFAAQLSSDDDDDDDGIILACASMPRGIS